MKMKADKPMRNSQFKVMSLVLKFRDALLPPTKILNEVEMTPGSIVLDYGCGPGRYSIASAEIVGGSGRVYALDIHPLALERVRQIGSERGFTNIETILSDCRTDLPDNSVDVALLYFVFHDFKKSNLVLKEIHRVLKPTGILSLRGFNMKKFSSEILDTDLFRLERKGKKTYTFSKIC